MAIKPSPRFAVLLLLFHAIVAIAVYAVSMPLQARLAVILLILLSLIYYMARDVFLLLPSSWRDIALNQNIVSVVSRDGSSFFGQAANKTIASPYFVVLRIRSDNYRLPVSRVIFPDALGAGEFRGLCVRLKFN
ncbi:MAG: protein YgfX [Gallionella sp.]